MRKIVILTVFILITSILSAQQEKFDFYYKEGLRYINEKEYALAYSMLKTAKKYKECVEIYEQMAIIDMINGDTCNYCTNLRKAKDFLQENSLNLIEDFCSDTIWYKDTINNYKLFCIESIVDCESFRFKNYYQIGDSVINQFYLLDSKYNVDMTSYETFPDIDKNLDRILGILDEKASYKGGESKLMKIIAENLRYPPQAYQNGIQGTVYISFIVSIDGNAENIQIFKSANEILDKEAVRVVSLLNGWTPAKYRGRPVNSTFIIPLKFKIE